MATLSTVTEQTGSGEQSGLSEAKRRLLEQRLRGLTGGAPDRIEPRVTGTVVPISSEQHRIWLHGAMEPDLPIYNESMTIERRGSCDLAVLEASFHEMLRRHEVWRTSFAMESGRLVQVVHPELKVRLPLSDLSGLPEEERWAAALRLACEDALVPIDVNQVPLFRVRVIRLSATVHWLQLTLHHIIFDGISIYRTFLPEFAAIYEAFAAGLPSPLPLPAVQYADYSLWRQRQESSPAMGQQLEYWKRELAGELPVTRLPLDRPRSAEMTHRGAMECFTFPEELMTRLRGLARARGVTLYMVLLAGLKAVFFRYGEQEDVIVGGLADGRRRPELESMMGYFLDTFAVRSRPAAGMAFAEYLGMVRDAVLGALGASEVPFSKVVEAVHPTRERSHHPIFQTFLSFQPHVEVAREGWQVIKTKVCPGVAKFDLYIEVEERPVETWTRFMYRTDLFDAATIRRMMGHWQTLLAAAVEHPECPLGELPMLPADERELMLTTWNRREMALPAKTLHGMVAAQARRTPDAVAAAFEAAAWTYAELEMQAEHLAGQLRRAGAKRGQLVAVCLQRSQYLAASLLAVLKTGAAYLPLDPGTPLARRKLCLEDAEPVVLLTQEDAREGLEIPERTTVLLLDEALKGERLEPGAPEEMGLEEAAYVIHTSGSTGRPKAVEISHRAVVNLLVTMQREPGFRATDTLLAVTTVSFDIAGLELFLPLIAGGKVVVASRMEALDPYMLADSIVAAGCTVLQATPATWRALLASGWRGVPGLKVLCGGEAMTRDLAESLLGLGLEVWNVYGPTETTIWSTAYRVTSGSGQVSVGRPIGNTTTYVLDARRQPVPVGVPGELYIGGTGLANGYRGQPELTAQKFITVDLGGGRTERLYRTGDYALLRADGRIEVQGRADNQVKVRGYRIELEDVESALAAHPGVGAGAAKVWPDAYGGNRLSAYLVGKAGAPPPSAGELRVFLKMRVPEYMIPSDVVALDAMPLTSNGKLDRKGLPAPVTEAERTIAKLPSTEQERRLAGLWTELLGVNAIGMSDNFFDLGGHSLLVARLQQRIAEEFGRRLPMAAIYHAPTLTLQTALLEVSEMALDAVHILPIQPKGTKVPLFWLEPTPLIGNLGRSLNEDQPLLGVTMTQDDLAGLGAVPDLRAMARCYMETILKARPQGPYLLGGLCVQGIVAYEVASQMQAAGHPVDALIMLDAENPVFYRSFGKVSVEWSKFRFYSSRALFRNGGSMFRRHMRSKLRKMMHLKDKARTEMSAIDKTTQTAFLTYQPPVYAGDVHLIVPKDRPAVVNYLSGWKGLVQGRLTSVEVDGHHDELLESSRAVGVAQAIEGYLAAFKAAGVAA